ncbi:MAG: DEAD/DEAH box helicase [Caldilineaceae bacterium]
MANIVTWRTQPARAPRYAPLPPTLHPALQSALQTRGINQLYSHQAQAVELALNGQHVAVVTPTASGKTLCYNLPVLHSLLSDPAARALYLFPTKALAHDQLNELRDQKPESREQRPESRDQRLDSGLRTPVSGLHVSTYDGDTPSADRSRIRQQARLILTNPDMLHAGILPYHTAWADFFAGLRYVVIDEMHTYRGVFGSHVANVLRRLQRICAFYGSHPQFICTSATIANPGQLAERLIEQPVTVIGENGAPSGEKHIILYNPPVYDAERGLRRSATLEAQELASRCILGGVQTIIFGRSRLTTEILLTYLRERIGRSSGREIEQDSALTIPHAALRGYRGGYLPNERRTIETGLRSGEVRGVVATNALELGIDIGQLQAAILCGYPGSIASTWQQMGRAGRTQETALALLVATGGPLDQYIIQHPEFLFERSPEHALINPDNLMLLVDQMRCAAFELPFQNAEPFGACPFTADVLNLLVEQGDLQQHGPRFFWSGEGYPARQVSLRNAGSDTVLIQAGGGQGARGWEQGAGGEEQGVNEPPLAGGFRTSHSALRTQIIGEIDYASAPLLVHAGAVYLHEGQSYRVDQLDLAHHLVQVTPVEVDYYTEVTAETAIEVLAEHERREATGALVAHGDLQVSSQVVGFRRIKRFTHENLGVFPLDYPPQIVEASGYWFSILPEAQAQLEEAGQWYDSINDYGPNWQEQRKRVRARDHYRCKQCGAPEAPDREHDVHHLIPFRTFGYVAGLNEHYKIANQLGNLILVCRTCHRRLEATVRVRSGLDGLAYALNNLAPLHLMCDPQDIGVSVVRGKGQGAGSRGQGAGGVALLKERGTEENSLPAPCPLPLAPANLSTVYVYERVTAGLGFSARLFELHDELLRATQRLIEDCPCQQGCPACVGPVLENPQAQLATKRLTLALLAVLTAGAVARAPVDDLGDVIF